MLDDATVYAIGLFQSYCNENYDPDLPTIDPLNPIIDADTGRSQIRGRELRQSEPSC